MRTHTPRPAFAALIAIAAACSSDPTTTALPRRLAMVIVSGDRQTAEVATPLANPLVVRVTDGTGTGIAGVRVLFRQTSSPSAVDSVTTDSRGVAPVRWTLGELAGNQEIVARATVSDASGARSATVIFLALAIAGAPSLVVAVGGDGAVAAPGSLVDTVVVAATDRFGNPTPNVGVDWRVTAGGGTIRPIDNRTGRLGDARAIWVAGPEEGRNALDVVVGPVTQQVTATASVSFPATVVAAGESHTCALAPSGAPYCWGDNSSGQVGIGRIEDAARTAPQRVSGVSSLVSLVAGSNHTCGLTADGSAYCWGNGRAGQLGNGFAGLAEAPVRVMAATFVALAAGARHTCALAKAGSIYCWGDNVYAQLARRGGPGGGSTMPVPVHVAGEAFTLIAAGSLSTCAVTNRGSTYCWGGNTMRELGRDIPGRCAIVGAQPAYDGTEPQPCSAEPAPMDLPPLAELAVNNSGWCGVTASTAVFCWGNNLDQPRVVTPARATKAWVVGPDVCGRNDSAPVVCWRVWGVAGFPVVQPFGDAVPLDRITAGNSHSCGISADAKGIVYCWGANFNGQLGDGTTNNRARPVAVLSPRVGADP